MLERKRTLKARIHYSSFQGPHDVEGDEDEVKNLFPIFDSQLKYIVIGVFFVNLGI
jgi:hypothetical protein